jgi:hypothetical protein
MEGEVDQARPSVNLFLSLMDLHGSFYTVHQNTPYILLCRRPPCHVSVPLVCQVSHSDARCAISIKHVIPFVVAVRKQKTQIDRRNLKPAAESLTSQYQDQLQNCDVCALFAS